MKIIGDGQLANIFKNCNLEDTIIFASGVSNSNCKDKNEFKREQDLLLYHLIGAKDKKFVYFSSCALSAENYELNAYYKHKQNMENLIKENSTNYYIFRLPQLFGNLKKHSTLINFIYNSIINDIEFTVFDEAYRYVIEISDVKKIVQSFLLNHHPNTIIDITNTYRYSVLDIVNTLEKLLNKRAKYKVIDKKDQYILDLSYIIQYVNKHNIDVPFGKEYLEKKLIKQLLQKE